jgi:hypothetical protein
MTSPPSVTRRRAALLSVGLAAAWGAWAAVAASGEPDRAVVACPVWRAHHVVAPNHVDLVYRGMLPSGARVWRTSWATAVPGYVGVDSSPLAPGGLAGVVESSCLAGVGRADG